MATIARALLALENAIAGGEDMAQALGRVARRYGVNPDTLETAYLGGEEWAD